MNILGISINHKTAPLEVREAVYLSVDEIKKLSLKLKDNLFSEGFILSTCNRTEIFGFPVSPEINYKHIQEFLFSEKPSVSVNSGHFLNYYSCSAVKHIFNVSAGIDSLIVGDSQILGQIKDSFLLSNQCGFAGTLSSKLFDAALKVGKRVINETTIQEGAVSVSYAAVQLIGKIFENLSDKKALIIGAGETSELAAVNLKDKGIGSITITNRTEEKSKKLSDNIKGFSIAFDNFRESLSDFDIIISATGSPETLLSSSDIEKAMKKRKNSPLCIMDLAVPRDIDPAAGNIEYVFYHDVDSLNKIIDKNLQKRVDEIPKVEQIITEEMISLFAWYNSLSVVPFIVELREFYEGIASDELQKIKNRVSKDDYPKIEEMTKRLLGRLLHNPTVNLKSVSESAISEPELQKNIALLKDIFGLNK